MIKTVSFAPPRATSGSKTAKSSASGSSASNSAPRRAAPSPATKAAAATTERETEIKSESKAKSAAAKSAAANNLAAKDSQTKSVAAKRATEESAPANGATAKSAVPKEEAPAALKAKRSRVPKDLAQQYGAVAEEAPRVVAAPAEAPRKRLTRAQREARSQLVRPDDDVLQRLARAGEVARPVVKRGRGWEFECGFCGRTTRFQTPGALCECGAIAVRE